MRIGHYAPNIWASGGVATYIRRVGQAQAARNNDVYYLTRVPSPRADERACIRVEDEAALYHRAAALDLDVLHLHKPVQTVPPAHVPAIRTLHDNSAACPSGSRYLARQKSPCNRRYSLAGCLWGHLIDHCGSRRPSKMRNSFHRLQAERQVLSTIPTITVSSYLKEEMTRMGYSPENIHVLHSPAPEKAAPYTPPPEGIPHFVFAGRIVPEKGVEWLLRAAARVAIPIHVDIAGDGYAMQEMQSVCTELGIDDRVTFHGWLSSDRLDAVFSEARAVVVPSVWHEPAGLVTLEAAALGRPVIASRVGGIPEYATEEFAALVAPNDIEDLAARITRFGEDAELAERMGRRGQSAVDARFDMASFLDRLSAIYC